MRAVPTTSRETPGLGGHGARIWVCV